MKHLHFAVANNLSVLHDELLTAIPNLRPVPNTLGRSDPLTGQVELEPAMAVEGDGSNLWLTVPDAADEIAIAAVVQAHDSTKSQPDPRRDHRARIAELNAIPRSNWTSAQMRELIDLLARNS